MTLSQGRSVSNVYHCELFNSEKLFNLLVKAFQEWEYSTDMEKNKRVYSFGIKGGSINWTNAKKDTGKAIKELQEYGYILDLECNENKNYKPCASEDFKRDSLDIKDFSEKKLKKIFSGSSWLFKCNW